MFFFTVYRSQISLVNIVLKRMKYIERMRVNQLRMKMGEAEVEGTLFACSLFSSLWWTFRHHQESREPGLKSTSIDHVGLCLEDEAYGRNRKIISKVMKDYWAITVI